MSDKYTPTTEDVRRAYQEHCRNYDAVDGLATSPESYEEEFDRWLESDKAEAALESNTAGVESLAKEALYAMPDNRLGTLSSYIATLERERDEARAGVSKIEGRALEAEAAIERVREAATEVTNQENNHGRTHYENCWKQHLHCLATKIIHETEADDE